MSHALGNLIGGLFGIAAAVFIICSVVRRR